MRTLASAVLIAMSVSVGAWQAPSAQQFEEASIRPCDPDALPPVPDGARGGGANSFQMTPGRTHAVCMTLATIIRTAYGFGPANLDFLTGGKMGPGGQDVNLNIVYGLGVEDGLRVRGGPDWIRTQRYTIDAVAADGANAVTMRGPMLQSLLEKRFQLKAHIETEQIPAFTLAVAKGGLKIKPVESGACEQVPPPTPGVPRVLPQRTADDVRRGVKPYCGLRGVRNGPNQQAIGGETTLEALATMLAAPLGGVRITDTTGVNDKFNVVLEYVLDDSTPGLVGRLPTPASSENVPRAQNIFVALEQQLGLKLEPARTPRDFIVIDRVERPGAN